MDDRNAERNIIAGVNESTQFDEGKLHIRVVGCNNCDANERQFVGVLLSMKRLDVNNKCCGDLDLIFMAQLLVLVMKNLNRNLN